MTKIDVNKVKQAIQEVESGEKKLVEAISDQAEATEEKKIPNWIRKSVLMDRWLDKEIKKMADEQNRPWNNMVTTLLKKGLVEWYQETGQIPPQQK